jgi:biofilm PGA synthesis N-glycosyltransferase PgaC
MEDVKQVVGMFVWVILIGMVFIPCFAMIFVTTTLLFKQKRSIPLEQYPAISILVACYNEQDNIVSTIESILDQNYQGDYEIIIGDDGSKDNSVKVIKENLPYVILLENEVNRGKSAVLNDALKVAKYDIIISIDSDTLLYKDALINIVSKFMSEDYSAVAGSIRVNNDRVNVMTRLQYWDYMLGIASIKQAQGIYNKTLVAQGAFSCYKKTVLEELKWSETMGEDIVLSWDMLKLGYKIGHANNAIVFTNVPEKYNNFFKQRKRWSIGLIEAFRRNWLLLFKSSQGLPFIWYNLLFPYIDISYMLFFFPSVILALVFNYYLLAGVLTLFLLPLGLSMNLVIIYIQRKINKEVGLKFNNDWIGFFLFILLFQLIQTPATITGYLSEVLRLKKSWGTR